MHLAERRAAVPKEGQRREFARVDIQCRARIVIGNRHYAGYLHNISRGGAKLRTISPIGKLGNILLRLPDLPPLRCRLRWSDSYNAGVAFELPLPAADLAKWTRNRSVIAKAVSCDIARLEPDSGLSSLSGG
jgi:hypothetical protein